MHLKLLAVFVVFGMLLSLNSAYGYNVSYVMQEFVTSPNANATAPSVYWPGQCTTSMLLYATATHSGTYTLTHSYFSPDLILLASNPKTRTSNIACQLQNADPQSTTSSQDDFFEATTRTEYTSTTIGTWLNLSYQCSPDANDLFIYNNTRAEDSYGNHPFGYGDSFGTCFEQSPAQCSDDLALDLAAVIAYLDAGYFTLCGDDLRQDAQGESNAVGSCGGIVSDIDMNYYIMTPFNAQGTGTVNVSVFERVGFQTNPASGGTLAFSNQYYLYDTVVNTTQDLGTAFPFTGSFNLVPDRDYFFLVGTRYFMDNHNCGAGVNWGVAHNYSSYDIVIDACETDFTFGDWSTCVDNLQTRTGTDQSDCNAPNRIEERSCFDVPEFDLALGFEAVREIDDGVYICVKDFWLGCGDVLDTIDALYPVNWTVITDTDNTGTSRDNYIKMSAETASVGSRSLKMWYIPPKISEPIPNGAATQCGNSSTGSFPEVNHPYNESLFVAQNVSFANPFPQLRYDVRKCSEPVLQFDYTGANILGFGLPNCGKLCYSSSCNATDFNEPRGRYGIRVADIDEEIIEEFPTFTFFDDSSVDRTENVTDGNELTFAEFSSGNTAIVNASTNIFSNGTILNFVVNASVGAVVLCITDDGNVLATADIATANDLYTFNLTLGNLSTPMNSINISGCAAPVRTVRMRLFEVENIINVTTTDIVFDFVGFSDSLLWQERVHDLSNAGLEVGRNYTIAITINPENQFDPFSHCVYLDNFRVTFTEQALPECVSSCQDLTLINAELSDNVCSFTLIENSPACIGDPTQRSIVESILAGEGGGEVTDNSTCIDADNDGINDDLYTYDFSRGTSLIFIDSEACLEQIQREAEGDSATEPIDPEEGVSWLFFLVSPLFIYFYITIGISAVSGVLVKRWEPFGIAFAFMMFLGMLITVPGGSVTIIPIWVGVAMIATISLLLAAKIKEFGFFGGG